MPHRNVDALVRLFLTFVNFFAHVVVAWRVRMADLPGVAVPRDDVAVRFALGAMLPDVASMCGVRLADASDFADAVIAAGVAEHHRADARFHASDAFVGLYAAHAQTLRAARLHRGSARAVAHVGIELLLDGALRDDAAAAAFHRALRLGVDAATSGAFACTDDAALRRLAVAFARLADSDPLAAYRDPDQVAARLARMLERRPPLALDADARRAVRAWIEPARESVTANTEALLADAIG